MTTIHEHPEVKRESGAHNVLYGPKKTIEKKRTFYLHDNGRVSRNHPGKQTQNAFKITRQVKQEVKDTNARVGPDANCSEHYDRSNQGNN